MATIRELKEAEFDGVVKSGVVLVDFWAPWCSSCRMLAKVIEQAAPAANADAVIAKVNIDEEQGLAVRFQVSTLPRLILFKDGKPVQDLTGIQSRPKIVELLNA